MPITTKVPLGASTLVRKWNLDVNTGTGLAPVWTGVFGLTDLKPKYELKRQDVSDFDSEGAMSEQATAYSWGIEVKARRGVTQADATAYDPGQEAIRLAANELGLDNLIEVRFYEVTNGGPKVESYQGTVSADWSPEGGSMDAVDSVSINLTGVGKRNLVPHPDAP